MGIVNLCDDSFSGDGTLDVDLALRQARDQVAAGADIVDVGAESARTNRAAISPGEEIARLLPFLDAFEGIVAEAFPEPPFDRQQLWPPLLSVNTWRPEVVAEILPCGVDILNDLSALPDARNSELCAAHGTALLIMHSVGAPKEPHLEEAYEDIWQALENFFEEKIALATSTGLSQDNLILDPGIDFAKQREDNLRIFADLERLHRFGRPVLLPVSRKTVIGDVLDIPGPAQRDAGTVAAITSGFTRGAHLFRVHNVRAAAQSLKVLDSIRSICPGSASP